MKSDSQATSTLTISTTGPSAALSNPSLRRNLLPIYAALNPFGMVLVGTALGIGGRRNRKLLGMVMCVLLVGSAVFLVSCGSGSKTTTGTSGTPAGSYAITVTASSGSTQHTSTVNLTVQ